MSCVAELNKSYAFRERCIRTYKTLCAYLDLSDDDDDEEEEDQVQQTQTIILQESPSCSKELSKIDETYEEIEVTEALLDKAKDISNQDEVMLDEITTILNSQAGNHKMEKAVDEDNLVFIIQNVTQQQQQSPSKTVNSYKCEHCELTFVRKKNYDNHYRRFHMDDDNGDAPVDKRIRLKLKDDKEDTQVWTLRLFYDFGVFRIFLWLVTQFFWNRIFYVINFNNWKATDV